MPTDTIPPLARAVRSLREERGYSLADLAARAELTYQAIYDIERGARPDPRWSTVQALADALGVSVSRLREKKSEKS